MSSTTPEPVAGALEADRIRCPREHENSADDLLDGLLVLARAETDDGRRTSFDQVLDMLGLSRDDLTEADADTENGAA